MEKKRPYTSPQSIVVETMGGNPLAASDKSLQFSTNTSTDEALSRDGGGWSDDE